MPDETSALLAEQRNDASNVAGYGNAPACDPEATPDAVDKPPLSLLTIVMPMAIGVFLCAMDQTIVVSSYAAIGSELKQLQNTSWIATAYMLTLTTFQPLYGKMSDIFGRKPCLLFAYILFALGCLACGLAQTMPQLILARGLTGIGGGGMSTVVSIIMSDIVPLRSRGTWQGIINIVYAFGSATGAPLGGFMVDTIGWRWGFLVQAPAIVLAFISVSYALHLPQSGASDFKTKLRRVDFSGALSLVLCVFFLLFGLDRGGNVAWEDTYTIAALCLFSIFFALFVAVELAWATEPFAPRRIIAHRALLGAYLVNFFAMMSGLSLIFHLSLFYQAVLRKEPAAVGLWLAPTVAAGVLGSLSGGLAIQATGRYYWVTVAAYAMMALGALGTTLQAGVLRTSAVGVAIASFFVSVGNGTGITTSLVALIANAGPADQAIATAVSYLFRSLGSVVGLSIASTLLQLTLRRGLRASLSDDRDIDDIIRRVRASLAAIDELDAPTAALVRAAYAVAVRATMWFSTAMAGCALVAATFIRETPITPPSRR
ncbi:MFS general substrate transporter [Mycena pura]|uniref:MFS general substrate transporter n=1 Tax=Mycena pura TaxID=153505 RepID=A0AAD6VBD4_9AGAR|nr:MFS general substrate transporter [Mycena pura]